MHGNAPLSPFTSVPGWESEAEQRLLMELAAQVPANGVIVEIGGEFGMSASLFCKGADKSVKIFTVDLFPGDLLSQHRANLAEAGFTGRSYQVAADSRNVTWFEVWTRGTLLEPNSPADIDLLFVDGDHTYEGVLADLENWTPFVKQGGLVVLHDVACETNKLPHLLHYEVARAFAEWLVPYEWSIENTVDSTVVVRKVGKANPVTTTAISGGAAGQDYPVMAGHKDQAIDLDDERTLSSDSIKPDAKIVIKASGEVVAEYPTLTDEEREFIASEFSKHYGLEDDERTLSKQSVPAELVSSTDMVDVDDEVHAPVEPELYDNPTYDEMTQYEPKEKPKRRTRKSKK